MSRSAKVVIGKLGLDGHDVGLRLIAAQLRDAGAEVVYLGKRNTPEGFVQAAEQEDASAIGVGSLTGGLAELTVELMGLLRERGLGDVRIVAGGIVEPDERRLIESLGIAFFGPGSSVADVVRALIVTDER
jgi:methylmalonyl-CoA mutase C-terminal domain/subunit